MKTVLRDIGNSRGLLIPKPVLAQIGLVDEVSLSIEDGALVVRPLAPPVREGWAEASRRLAEADEPMVWPEFANEDDDRLKW